MISLMIRRNTMKKEMMTAKRKNKNTSKTFTMMESRNKLMTKMIL